MKMGLFKRKKKMTLGDLIKKLETDPNNLTQDELIMFVTVKSFTNIKNEAKDMMII